MKSSATRSGIDAEVLIAVAVLSAAAVIGLATVGDYGMTVDEFTADDYGPKALAWYTSGFTDGSTFDDVEHTLWFYGPWFHIFTAVVQSLKIADHWTVRHALNFLGGLAGIAALLPIGRLAIGRWAGLVAIILCLTTGYLYGSFFFTPIDVPFLLAMCWTTLAIVVMAGQAVPSWPATIAVGLLTGLAIATRSSGLITHAYLIGAAVLCGLEAIVCDSDSMRKPLLQIATRTVSAILIAWATAFALWPWLQIGNPFAHFKEAFLYFANHPNAFDFPHWGEQVKTTNLSWSYVPAQLAIRLPEGFLLLLAIGSLFGLASAFGFLWSGCRALARRRMSQLKAAALVMARSRRTLIVWTAAILPLAAIIIQRSTLYDGIRHVLFLIPMLALIAAFGFLRLLPLLSRFPVAAAVAGGGYLAYAVLTLALLHPLEYMAVNPIPGGVHGAYGRFELDYWSLAANVALRRLEHRLDYDPPERFVENPPSIMICIPWRKDRVAPMFRRPWRLETASGKADFLITTERRLDDCAKDAPAVLIDEIKRFGRTFAWVYARRSALRAQSLAAQPQGNSTPTSAVP